MHEKTVLQKLQASDAFSAPAVSRGKVLTFELASVTARGGTQIVFYPPPFQKIFSTKVGDRKDCVSPLWKKWQLVLSLFCISPTVPHFSSSPLLFSCFPLLHQQR